MAIVGENSVGRVYEAIAAGDARGAHQAMAELLDMALLDTTRARTSRPGAATSRPVDA